MAVLIKVLSPIESTCFISALYACDSPLVVKVRSRAGSGVNTPGGGAFKSLSEKDLQKADAALNQVNTVTPTAPVVETVQEGEKKA